MGFFSKIFGEEKKSSVLSDKNYQMLLEQASKIMLMYLVAAYPILSLEKKLKVKNSRTGKERYLLSICFLFGIHAQILDELVSNLDKRAPEYMQSIVHIFHTSMPDIMKKKFFPGINFKPNKEGGFSQLNADTCKWYLKKAIKPDRNDNFYKVKITGTHAMYLSIKKKLSAEENKKFKIMGSYVNDSKNTHFSLSNIFRDEKTKFKF